MAMRQDIIDRYKAQGFYKHVEWNRRWGVLIKVYDTTPESLQQKVTFQAGTHDVEYDQRLDGYRQFFVERRDAVQFMLNMGMVPLEIAKAFKLIDGCQEVTKYV